ncbi:MAG: YdgA family protein [Woeseiaceae bacterium]|nr:YdgA family protein [Woeseiaceae bacterium]
MNRWVVVLLVLLAVILLVSPGIVGRIAEQNLDNNIEWAEGEAVGIEFRQESFDRGWFSSEGRHRVVLTGAALREATEALRREGSYAEPPSLIIDTHIDHGLVPITSLGRESGTLTPSLASAMSTFHVDPGNGELIALPGALHSRVNFDGASDWRYLLKAGEHEVEDGRIEWQGADITVNADRTGATLVTNGTIEPISIVGQNETVRLGRMTVTANQARSEYGMYTGTAAATMESMSVETALAPFSVGQIAVASDIGIADARLNAATQFAVADIAVPGMGDTDFEMDIDFTGLDAASVQLVNQALRDIQASANPEDTALASFGEIEEGFQRIAAAGASVHIKKLNLSLPQGTVATTMNIDIAETGDADDFSWGAVLLNTTADANIRVPKELYEFMQLMNPQAASLTAMGLLQLDGEDYVMNAEYAQGLLNVNGAPLPIPMPGM